MKYKLKLAAVLGLVITGASTAQAVTTTYSVKETFYEPAYHGMENTVFQGTFAYNSVSQQITNLTGTLSEAMTGMMHGGVQTLLNLNYNPVASSIDMNGGIMASAFLLNTTSIYKMGGTYNSAAMMKDPNFANAYATIYVSADQLSGANMNLPGSAFGNLYYGDCQPGGLMMQGKMCMTGWGVAGTAGSMGGYPISEVVTAVPSPSTVWTVLSGAIGLLFVTDQRKKLFNFSA